MEIKTGYFGKMKKYIELGYTPVGIVLFKPKWYTGENLRKYAPSIGLFNDYRNKSINGEEFYTVYKQEIEKTSIFPFKRYIEELKSRGINKIVLLCFEKPEDVCHRHVFAEFIKEKLGIEVCELLV